MNKTYTYGKYTVDVANDGAIVVKPGDWLSKYYSAINQSAVSNTDLNAIARAFGRMGKGAKIHSFAEQGDINRIIAGEVLYHIPSTIKNPPSPPLGSQERPIVVDLSKAVDGSDMLAHWIKNLFGWSATGPGVTLGYEASGTTILKHVMKSVKPWQYYTRKSAPQELWRLIEMNCGANKFYTQDQDRPFSTSEITHILAPFNHHAVKAWEDAYDKKWKEYLWKLRRECPPEMFT